MNLTPEATRDETPKFDLSNSRLQNLTSFTGVLCQPVAIELELVVGSGQALFSVLAGHHVAGSAIIDLPWGEQ
jgi:hypothetical protein